MEAFLLSTAVIFIAELGDKSQLMAMTFALGAAVGPLVGAAVLDHLGGAWLWVGCGVAGLVGAAAMGPVARSPRVDAAH